MHTEYSGSFGDLPDLMLVRHLQKCLPPKWLDSLPLFDLKDGDSGLRSEFRHQLRVIAVVGAGASAPIMTRAKDLIAQLKRELRVEDDRHEQKMARITRRTGLQADAFETE